MTTFISLPELVDFLEKGTMCVIEVPSDHEKHDTMAFLPRILNEYFRHTNGRAWHFTLTKLGKSAFIEFGSRPMVALPFHAHIANLTYEGLKEEWGVKEMRVLYEPNTVTGPRQ